jgi:TetR/AcrR family transcriptional regulator, transcriptional repressor for nem operon
MRISKAAAAANRSRVLEVATRLFREKGIEGVGLADLMSEAGLTHGGFYNHFESKEALVADACKVAFDAAVARLQDDAVHPKTKRRLKDKIPDEVFEYYVRRYLSLETRDAPGKSCPMAALGADAARHGPQVKTAFADGVRRYLEAFQNVIPGDQGKVNNPQKRGRAIVTLSTLIGALTLARSVAGVDEKLSKEILAAVRDHLLEEA